MFDTFTWLIAGQKNVKLSRSDNMAIRCLYNSSVLFLFIFVLYLKSSSTNFNKEYTAPRLHYDLEKKTSESFIFADSSIYRIRFGKTPIYLDNYLLKTRPYCIIIFYVKYLKKKFNYYKNSTFYFNLLSCVLEMWRSTPDQLRITH